MSALVRFETDSLHLLGDVHGRWDRVAQALTRAGLLDGEGRFGAPAGTVLLQVGDLVDRGRDLTVTRERCAAALERVPPAARVQGPTREEPVPLRVILEEEERHAFEHRAVLAALDSLETLQRFRGLQAEAEAGGSRLICLLGNHDLDLLRGEFIYFDEEKRCLLALCGVPPERIDAHAEGGIPLDELCATSAELAWLAGLPLLACGAGVVAVHGGPTRALVDSLDADGIAALDDLGLALDAARARGFSDSAFAEGTSLFSPDAPRDDAVHDRDLLRRFLRLAGAETLAVGHSPFIHTHKGRWVDLADPAARVAVEAPALLGAGVLKLDTNMKRGGPAWVVRREGNGWSALREDGHERALVAPALAEEDAEQPGAERAREGVDPHQLRQAQDAAKRAGEPRLARALARLLYLGATDLQPVVRAAASGQLESLEEQVADADARLSGFVADLRSRLPDHDAATPLLFLPAPTDCRTRAGLLPLGPLAARELRKQAGGESPTPRIITVSYFHRGEAPFARVSLLDPQGGLDEVTRPLSAWPPDPTEVAELARGVEPAQERVVLSVPRGPARPRPEAPPLAEGPLRAAALRWAERNAERWGSRGPWQVVRPHALAGELPGRCQVRAPDARPILLQALPDRAVVPLDNSLLDPRSAFWIESLDPSSESLEHPVYLRRHLPEGDVVSLHCAVSAELECLLRLGEFESLGQSDPGRPPWQRGRYLFCSPWPDDCRPFLAFKPSLLRFAVPRGELFSALETDLLTLHLFAPSGGETLTAHTHLGTPDVGLEVVALGDAGVEWLWGYLTSC